VRTGFATLEHTFANDWVAKLQLNHQVNGYDAALAGAAAGNPDPLTGEGVSLWLGKYVGKTVSNAADFYVAGISACSAASMSWWSVAVPRASAGPIPATARRRGSRIPCRTEAGMATLPNRSGSAPATTMK
jgi:hypothetical protein